MVTYFVKDNPNIATDIGYTMSNSWNSRQIRKDAEKFDGGFDIEAIKRRYRNIARLNQPFYNKWDKSKKKWVAKTESEIREQIQFAFREKPKTDIWRKEDMILAKSDRRYQKMRIDDDE
jgi:hypothetical protein